MNVRIMVVDDEVQVLKALSRAFMDTEYELLTAESGKEALELLETFPAEIIISDMRMPYMDGYQLLDRIKQKYPDMIRIIISGYTDEAIVYKALQSNIAKHYIFKPWENGKLVSMIDHILETERMLEKDNLLAFINSVDELPTIKTSYQKILSGIDNDFELKDIISLIEQDQSIASKLLKVANSAFYGIKTGSVKHAVTYLGLSNVRNLILSTSILDAFGAGPDGNKIMETLWVHAINTNRLLSFMYEEFLQKKLPDTAMAAGLLHNIGHLLLYNKFTDKFIKFADEIRKDHSDVLAGERSVYGVDHQLVGGYLLKWWELPFPIVEAALYHHDPLNQCISNTELIYVLNIAQGYSWPLLNPNAAGALTEELLPRLGIDRIVFDQKMANLSR